MSDTQELDTINTIKDLVVDFHKNNDEKRTYLAWRIAGFTLPETVKFTKISPDTITTWLLEDESFLEYEQSLPELKKTMPRQILDAQVLRNQYLMNEIEADVLEDAKINGVDKLNVQSFKLLEKIRTQNNPQVRGALGLGESDTMPTTMDEVIMALTLRRVRTNVES